VLRVVAEVRPLLLAERGLRVPLEQEALARDVGHALVLAERRWREQPAPGLLGEAGRVAAGQPVVGVQQPEPRARQDLVGRRGGIDLGDRRARQELVVVGDRRPRGQRLARARVEGAIRCCHGTFCPLSSRLAAAASVVWY